MNDTSEIYYDHLKVLAKGYLTGDFSGLFDRLAEDCVWESMWVLGPRVGYDVVKAYYEEKGQMLVENNCCAQRAIIVELVGNLNMGDPVTDEKGKRMPMVGLLYDHGELCLYMEQTTDEQKNYSLVKLTLNENHKIKRIDMCEPSFFRFRKFEEIKIND